MILTRDIQGQTINFVVGDDTCPGDDTVESPAQAQRALRSRRPFPVSGALLHARIRELVDAMNRLPWPHLFILRNVPIVIVTAFPTGSVRSTGGWYPPRHPGEPLADRWFTEPGPRNTHVSVATLEGLPHRNGIIGLSTLTLLESPSQRPGAALPWQLTLLHEIGHCVDFHGHPRRPMCGLESPGDPAYRGGNQAYQGQVYSGEAYNALEFRAETYSRLFLTPQRMCRREDAHPPCVTSRNHADCSERLQRDLARSTAFLMLGINMNFYLPLAASPPPGAAAAAG